MNIILKEVFTVHNDLRLKPALIDFLHVEFKNGDLESVNQGPSATEYKPDDWYENIADNIVNRLRQYFQTTKGQTQRDM